MARRSVSTWFQQAQTFLTFRAETKRADQRRKDARDWLEEWLLDHGDEDEQTGHRRMNFPEPVVIDGVKYSGLILRKNVTKQLDVDRAIDLLDEKKLSHRVRKLRPAEYYWDWAEIDVLVQEGLITEDQFDSLIDSDITWALWPNEE